LLPILGGLYSVALIDRTNMANANIAGMAVDLNLDVGDRYSIALLVFFVPVSFLSKAQSQEHSGE